MGWRYLLGVLAITTGACGQERAQVRDLEGCSSTLPACDAAPSWRSTVAPIVERSCAGCHVPGGEAADRPLTGYDDVSARRNIVLDSVYTCSMPPLDSPIDAFRAGERELLMRWLVCGGPNN